MSGETKETGGLLSLKESVREAFGVIEKLYEESDQGVKGPVRHTTGFATLDRACGGLAHADLNLVAARRSSLAAQLLRQVAVGAAVEKQPVLVCCVRGPVLRWTLHALCSEARVDLARLLGGFLEDEDWGRIARAAGLLSEVDLTLVSSLDLDQLSALARDWRREHAGEGMVVVDAVERLGRDAALICRRLKELARELDLPLLAGLGLKSGVGPGDGGLMNVEDLRDMGDLDLIAGRLLLLSMSWPEYPSDDDVDGWVQVHVPSAYLEGWRVANLPFSWSTGRIGDRTRFPVRRRDRDEQDEEQAPDGRVALVACGDDFGLGQALAEILHGELGASFSEEQLLSHPRLGKSLHKELRESMKGDLAAAWIGSIFLRKRDEDGRWEWADLARAGLLSMERERLMAVLFDGVRARDGFDYAPLLRLMRSAERLISWGDGAVSDGKWLVKAPQALGVLGYRFDTEHSGRRARPRRLYERLLKVEDRAPDLLDGKDAQGRYRLADSGAALDAKALDSLLAVFGASATDLKDVELLAAPFADNVLLCRNGEILGALLADNAEAWRVI